MDMARGPAAVVDTTHGGPAPPTITNKDIWTQFKIDIAGKEVQSAETYSHSWLANQFGHVCLGILLASLLGVAAGTGLATVGSWLGLPPSWHFAAPWDLVVGSVLAALGVSWWEWRAYRLAAQSATGSFPLDRPLLRDNAVVAAAYMLIGVAIALTHRLFTVTAGEWLGVPNVVWGALCFLGLVIVAVRLALRWLRQKIVWQKAGLPYLFRLSETRPTMDCKDVLELQHLIERAPPPAPHPSPIVIGGPIGSGRTEFAAAIGTEFAFRQVSVRYLSFSTLLEFVARSQNPPDFFNDTGPVNISYWPWSKAQVVIIDDIGPLLTSQGTANEHLVEGFRFILAEQLTRARAVLAQCHTVWVIGDLRGAGQIADGAEELDRFGEVIREFCTGSGEDQPRVLVAQLAGDAEAESPPQRQQRSKTPRVAAIHYLR
jgi:hypothetical protein